jgi:cell division protein FtsL
MKKIVLFIVSLFIAVNTIYAQCPMCKASVESSQSSGTKSVGMGLNVGILMLLLSVYIILMAVGVLWYFKFRKNQLNSNAV